MRSSELFALEADAAVPRKTRMPRQRLGDVQLRYAQRDLASLGLQAARNGQRRYRDAPLCAHGQPAGLGIQQRVQRLLDRRWFLIRSPAMIETTTEPIGAMSSRLMIGLPG
jgi:hypothetical protein